MKALPLMYTETHIFRTASVLLEEHGGNAAKKAKEKEEEARASGNINDAIIWYRVFSAIRWLKEPLVLSHDETQH